MTIVVEPEFSKKLSANDVGVTKSHQAGFLIPIPIAKTNYFPKLDFTQLNPREIVRFEIMDTDQFLELNYIYYNSRYHGTGTRLEYRLTGLTGFIRSFKLAPGDEIEFFLLNSNKRSLKIVKQDEIVNDTNRNLAYISRNGWKIKERHKNES